MSKMILSLNPVAGDLDKTKSPFFPPASTHRGCWSQCCLSSSGSGAFHLPTTLSHEGPSKNGQSQTSWGEDDFPCLIQKALTIEKPHANPLAVVSCPELSCLLSRLGQHTESCWKLLSSHWALPLNNNLWKPTFTVHSGPRERAVSRQRM